MKYYKVVKNVNFFLALILVGVTIYGTFRFVKFHNTETDNAILMNKIVNSMPAVDINNVVKGIPNGSIEFITGFKIKDGQVVPTKVDDIDNSEFIYYEYNIKTSDVQWSMRYLEEQKIPALAVSADKNSIQLSVLNSNYKG